MQAFDLIIFDLDGVLVDSSPAHAAAYEALYQALQVPGRPYADIAGRPTRAVVAELLLGREEAPSSLDRWVAFKQAEARRLIERPGLVFADAPDALDALREAGIAVAVGTSASRQTAHAVLRAAGWSDRFRTVVTADDVSAGKPDPEIYLRVLAATGARPRRTLIVEDSGAGLAAGVAAGAWVVSVRTGEVVATDRFLGSFADLDAVVALATAKVSWATSF